MNKRTRPEEVRPESAVAAPTEPQKKKRGCLGGCFTRTGAVVALVALVVIIIASAIANNAAEDEPTLTPTTIAQQVQATDSPPPTASDPTNEPATEPQDDEPDIAMQELDGEVLIYTDTNFVMSGDSCEGTGEYSDIVPGATITIRPQGHEAIMAELGDSALSREGNCRLPFTPMIPEADEYTFSIGEHVQVSQGEDMLAPEPQGWWVTVGFD